MREPSKRRSTLAECSRANKDGPRYARLRDFGRSIRRAGLRRLAAALKISVHKTACRGRNCTAPAWTDHHERYKDLSVSLEIGAAATIDPDALAVPSPRLPLHARRTAALIHQPHPAPGIGRAEIPLTVRGAGDRPAWRRRRRSWRGAIAASGRWIIAVARRRIAPAATAPNDKVRTAAPIDPDAAVVITPALPLNARRSAALVHHAHAALRIDPAIMTLHIVRSTGNVGVIQ